MNCEKCGTVMAGYTAHQCPKCNFKHVSGILSESLVAENTQLSQRVEELEKQVEECGRKFLQENATNVQQLNQCIRQLEAEVAVLKACLIGQAKTSAYYNGHSDRGEKPSLNFQGKHAWWDYLDSFGQKALSTPTGKAILAKLEAGEKIELLLEEILAMVNQSLAEIPCLNSIGIIVSIETKLRIEAALSAWRATGKGAKE